MISKTAKTAARHKGKEIQKVLQTIYASLPDPNSLTLPLSLKLQNALVPQYLQLPVGAALRRARFERILGADMRFGSKYCRMLIINIKED